MLTRKFSITTDPIEVLKRPTRGLTVKGTNTPPALISKWATCIHTRLQTSDSNSNGVTAEEANEISTNSVKLVWRKRGGPRWTVPSKNPCTMDACPGRTDPIWRAAFLLPRLAHGFMYLAPPVYRYLYAKHRAYVPRYDLICRKAYQCAQRLRVPIIILASSFATPLVGDFFRLAWLAVSRGLAPATPTEPNVERGSPTSGRRDTAPTTTRATPLPVAEAQQARAR